jgi:hypothetical protein
MGLRRRRASKGSHRRHIAGPCRGARLGIRTSGLVAYSRTLDLDDARVGLPRPRRAGTQGTEKTRAELVGPSRTRSAYASTG